MLNNLPGAREVFPDAANGALKHFCDSAAVTAKRTLGSTSTSTCPRDPHALRLRFVHNVLRQALHLWDIEQKCITRCRCHGLRGPGCRRRRRPQLDVYDRRGRVRGTVTVSTQRSTTRIERTFYCSVLRIDGAFRRMLMSFEAETTKSAGTAAEKTDEGPMIRWWTTIREPAQKPPDESRMLATEPSMPFWRPVRHALCTEEDRYVALKVRA